MYTIFHNNEILIYLWITRHLDKNILLFNCIDYYLMSAK